MIDPLKWALDHYYSGGEITRAEYLVERYGLISAIKFLAQQAEKFDRCLAEYKEPRVETSAGQILIWREGQTRRRPAVTISVEEFARQRMVRLWQL